MSAMMETTGTLPLRERILQVLTPDATGGSSRLSLQRLLLLRLVVAVLCVVGTFIFHSISPLELPILQLAAATVFIVVSLLFGFWRLHKDIPISEPELFSQLLVDAGTLVLVLLATGGASNPLISYLLVLLTIGATMLHQRYVNVLAIASIVVYTSFLLSELRMDHSDHMVANFQLHLVGMWVTFVVSAVLITVFVTRMAEAIRSRELTLARARENEMRNEQLVAIGTLAAGTAHALGTPLSTMYVLLTDLDKYSDEQLRSMDIKEDISLLREQVVRCKDSLTQLTRFYNKADRHPYGGTLPEFMAEIQDYIVNIHPRAKVSFELLPAARGATIPFDLSVRHAIINLVENAIKAAHSQVSVSCRVINEHAEIAIQDDGPGIPSSVMENMGEPFISTRKDSMGIGIFLANAAIQRASGNIEMFNLKTGGAMSIIRLPVGATAPGTSDDSPLEK
ncbi:MAG: HAMP domain-containing histidine kinase [Pseudomonadales bacterium]|nr:HAMP domain-containing histidine kinase [Pseudomonadales bacterium]MCP5356583.1 HAMP domain-containing histidine kinase [Pseudomonadales bacterium]